jgi:hypothetical protein
MQSNIGRAIDRIVQMSNWVFLINLDIIHLIILPKLKSLGGINLINIHIGFTHRM